MENFTAKLAEGIPWNRLYIYLIGTYTISNKRKNLIIQSGLMVDPAKGSFETT